MPSNCKPLIFRGKRWGAAELFLARPGRGSCAEARVSGGDASPRGWLVGPGQSFFLPYSGWPVVTTRQGLPSPPIDPNDVNGVPMISAEKQANALEALHKVLILTRMMAYQNEPGADIADVLDVAEYLVVLIMKPEDKTAEFRQYLESMTQKREHFRHALRWFDEPPV